MARTIEESLEAERIWLFGFREKEGVQEEESYQGKANGDSDRFIRGRRFRIKMKKTKKVLGIVNGNKGCRGRRIKIVPEKSDVLGQDELIQRGKVVGAGPEARCKVGDTIIFSTDGFDKVVIGEDSFYYVLDTDVFVYEIL